MPRDIVKRLRDHSISIANFEEAADEIDRLRAEVAELRKGLQKIADWKTDGYEVAVAREVLWRPAPPGKEE